MDSISRVMLELMEHLLSSPPECRSLENVERILPFFRTRTPLFHNLSKGEGLSIGSLKTKVNQISICTMQQAVQ